MKSKVKQSFKIYEISNKPLFLQFPIQKIDYFL